MDSSKACVKSDCIQEIVKKYILINDLSCTDCQGTDYSLYNATFCQKMPKLTISAAVQSTGKVQASFICLQGKNLYWIYGLGGSAFVNLSKIQELLMNSISDPLYYRTVGKQSITAGQRVVIEALPNIKNSGEKYTLVVFCEYLGFNSTAYINFISFNNTKLETLVIGLQTTGSLSSAQKISVAGAIATVLKTNKTVWTDDDKTAQASASRILQNYNTVNFYILPDYTSSVAADDEIKKLKTTITATSTKFSSDITSKAALPSVTFTGASAISFVKCKIFSFLI